MQYILQQKKFCTNDTAYRNCSFVILQIHMVFIMC